LEEARKIKEIADLLRHKDSIVSLQEFSDGEMMTTKDPFKSWTFSPLYDDMPMNVSSSIETLNILHAVSPVVSTLRNLTALKGIVML
jgi:hypothetical protein